MRVIFIIFFIACTIFPNISYSERNFPTNIEIQGIVKTCAGGYSTSIQGDIETGLKKWVSNSELKGEGNVKELGGILDSVSSDEAKITVYSIYASCIKDVLPKYLGDSEVEKSKPVNGVLKVPIGTNASDVMNFVSNPEWMPNNDQLILNYKQNLYGITWDVYQTFYDNKAVKARLLKTSSYKDQYQHNSHSESGSEDEVTSYCSGSMYKKVINSLISQYGSPITSPPEYKDTSRQLRNLSAGCASTPVVHKCSNSGNKRKSTYYFELSNGISLDLNVTSESENYDYYRERYSGGQEYNNSIKILTCTLELYIENKMF